MPESPVIKRVLLFGRAHVTKQYNGWGVAMMSRLDVAIAQIFIDMNVRWQTISTSANRVYIEVFMTDEEFLQFKLTFDGTFEERTSLLE